MIDLHKPHLNKNSYKYIKNCLKTGYVSTSGNYVKKFESEINKRLNSKYSIAVNSGSSALYLALKLSNTKYGDEILVQTLTFISPINAILQNNLCPIFMDVDNNFNIDQEKTIDFINTNTVFKNGKTINKKTKKNISAIVIIHIFGVPSKFEKLYNLCKKRNIDIIEDAAESMGSKYLTGKFKNKYVGTIGKFGCLSFNANKIITTAAGGVILTQNKNLAIKTLYMSTTAKNDPIKFIHNKSGYNLRLNNICAALGLSQIEELKKYLIIKKQIFNYYKFFLKDFPNAEIFIPPKNIQSNNWLILLKVKKNKLNILLNTLNKKNIKVRPVWKLNHTQKPFNKFQTYKLFNCYKMQSSYLCLPAGIDLKITEIKKICKFIKDILK